jgi:hypothetical protein
MTFGQRDHVFRVIEIAEEERPESEAFIGFGE